MTTHPYHDHPDRTLIRLSFPVLLSLIAEPLTGLIDTGFVARLGAESLAALGVGAIILSGSFWIFNFLGIGTQTDVARADGSEDRSRIRGISTLAMIMALVIGVTVAIVGWVVAAPVSRLMGAAGLVEELAVEYLRLRLLGAPAVLLTIAGFGALRGLQDMKSPMMIAIGVNVVNLIADPILIFGWGPVEAMGVGGAAIASTGSQWFGALVTGGIVVSRIGFGDARWSDAGALLVVGRDLFLRTSALTLFLILATRSATEAGAEEGAVHQAIRQVWTFTALFLDAFAVTGQALISYFLGAARIDVARNVAARVCGWSTVVGFLLAAAMIAGTGWARALLVPSEAHELFGVAWLIAALSQPLNALAFATDGIHWGTSDFRFLRNVVIMSTVVGGVLLFIPHSVENALVWIWGVTVLWIAIRATAGILRIWPAMGSAPLKING